MKKFLVVLVALVAFTACNNSSDSTKTDDTTTIRPDSTPVITLPDSTSVDSLHKMDTTKKK
jgi:hypothetical protein